MTRRLERAAAIVVYVAIVGWAAVHHEPWRDEVVPLSIARNAASLAELAAPLRFEGHPILWYLVLWAGWTVVGHAWVLKAASVGAAVGAIVLLNLGPLPWWIRWPFTFSFFPIYQYSVVSRGYCLVMLLLFGFCALYPQRRAHPFALALVLAGLANTEVFGFVMALAAVAMLVVDGLTDPRTIREVVRDRWARAGALVLLGAFALAVAVAFPDPAHRGTVPRQIDVARLAVGVGEAIVRPAAHAARMIVLPMASLWVWAYFVYLTRRPPLLVFAAAALIGIETVFHVIGWVTAPWHLGNALLIVVATAWLDAGEPPPRANLPASLERVRGGLGWVLAGGLVIVTLDHVWLGADYVRADLEYEHSSNRRLAALLRDDAALANAIVTGEPDTPLWSLPYYADARIYLPREATFRDWGMFGSDRVAAYDLTALLGTARRLREGCACPVVVTLGWELGSPGVHTNFPGTRFEERFLVTAEARADFLAAMQPVARLRGPTITDENYDVWVLR